MPKPTWSNLPEDKRRRITESAMAEFGERGFSGGSLNAVVARAGIAKGSLFQYFDDKVDLFVTICEVASSSIEAETMAQIDVDAPFADFLRDLFQTWVAYFESHPLERRVGFAASHEVDATVRAVLQSTTNERYSAALEPVVRRAIERGELRADVDPGLAVSMITITLRHLRSAPFEPAGDPALLLDEMDGEALADAVDAFVHALVCAFT